MKILVVDDQPTTLSILSTYLESLGHDLVSAENGKQALRRFTQCAPDVVLLDVHMPHMDGFEVAQRIRAADSRAWTPIVLLSADDAEPFKLRGLDVADDYLVKPVNVQILRKKLENLTRLLSLQEHLDHERRVLATINAKLDGEAKMAAHVAGRILERGGSPDATVQMRSGADAAAFTGDIVLAEKAPNGNTYLLVASAAHPGLAGVLNLMPALSVFDSMVRRGFAVEHVAAELDARLKGLLPQGCAVQAIVLSVDYDNAHVRICNAGAPDVLHFDGRGELKARFAAIASSLGAMADEASPPAAVASPLDAGDCVLAVSSRSTRHLQQRELDLEKLVRETIRTHGPAERFAALARALEGDATAARPALALVQVPAIDAVRRTEDDAQAREAEAGHVVLRFDAVALREGDALTAALSALAATRLDAGVESVASTVLAELLTNAIEHGVLQLDSSMKRSGEEGFQRYFEARAAKLAALATGFVEVCAERAMLDAVPCLKLTVTDSGAGFDAARYTYVPEAGEFFYGSGLRTMQGMCARLEFSARGNSVCAYIARA